jgi:hypothetical protein
MEPRVLGGGVRDETVRAAAKNGAANGGKPKDGAANGGVEGAALGGAATLRQLQLEGLA